VYNGIICLELSILYVYYYLIKKDDWFDIFKLLIQITPFFVGLIYYNFYINIPIQLKVIHHENNNNTIKFNELRRNSIISITSNENKIDFSKWKNKKYSLINKSFLNRYSNNSNQFLNEKQNKFNNFSGRRNKKYNKRINSWHGETLWDEFNMPTSIKKKNLIPSSSPLLSNKNRLSLNSAISSDIGSLSINSEIFDSEFNKSLIDDYDDSIVEEEEKDDDACINEKLIDMSIDINEPESCNNLHSHFDFNESENSSMYKTSNNKLKIFSTYLYEKLTIKNNIENQNLLFLKPFKLKKSE
jgi:hypothetical protein